MHSGIIIIMIMIVSMIIRQKNVYYASVSALLSFNNKRHQNMEKNKKENHFTKIIIKKGVWTCGNRIYITCKKDVHLTGKYK